MAKRKLKIYIDTSVISALLDERQPERQRQTKEFWEQIKNYDVYISALVKQEIQNHPDPKIKKELLGLVKSFKILKTNQPPIQALAKVYIQQKAVPKSHPEDALHLATATVHGMDVVVSWNYRHMVKLKTVKKIQTLNALKEYGSIEIITPLNL